MLLCYNAPHTPMQAKPQDEQQYQHVSDPKRRTYAAMVTAMDRGIGRVLDRLGERGERDNTLVVFLSDNGGPRDNASWNGLLSGGKGTLREGGIRVPMIWSWPNTIDSHQTCGQVLSSLDILPTFLAAAGATPLKMLPGPKYEDRSNQASRSHTVACEGKNALPLLAGNGAAAGRELYWRLQGQAAVLDGDYKLVRLGHRPAQLFKLADDPGEQHDRAVKQPEKYRQLYQKLGDWEASLATIPIWDSSPYWWGVSADLYDNQGVRPEPK